MLIDGLKLIFKTGSVDIADDPLLPWRLEARFRPEEFMQVAFTIVGPDGASELAGAQAGGETS